MIAAASKTKYEDNQTFKDYTASKSFDEDTILEDVDKEKDTVMTEQEELKVVQDMMLFKILNSAESPPLFVGIVLII